MMSYRNHRFRDFVLPMSTVWLLNDIAEARGKQELYTRQSPQILKALREMALIQSAESSNRIEGVTVAPDRLQPLVLGRARPRDRSEQEVFGYRRALNEIHTRARLRVPCGPTSACTSCLQNCRSGAASGVLKQVAHGGAFGGIVGI